MNYKDLLSELQDMKYWIEKEGMIATLDEAIARAEKAIKHLEIETEEEHFDNSEEVEKEEQELADWEDDSEDY